MATNTVATGVDGLDEILEGGLTASRVYLIEGDPGAGKTTLALQFLLEGQARGERCLYVTLSETKEELLEVGRSHGWSLEGLNICELVVGEDSLKPESQYTIFQPSEVELSDTINAVLSEFEKIRPARLVFDSLSEVRLLAQNSLRYRRQTLALKQFFIGRDCTVLLLDDRTSDSRDLQLHSIAHGVITLEQLAPEYGTTRRRLRIMKMRGRNYRGGFHDFQIQRGGIVAYPRLPSTDSSATFERAQLPSGVPELDQMLHGGVDKGTSTLLIGPAGSGKSTVAMQFAMEAWERGEKAALFAFDESISTLMTRANSLGIDLGRAVDSGLLHIQQIDPAELSLGEFACLVENVVDPPTGDGVGIVIIDSLNGYLQSMPEERFLVAQLHQLLSYLGARGVASFLVVAQHGLVGATVQTPVDATYLADTVILFRFFEAMGEMRKAVSVVKRRGGPHEQAIRELTLGRGGVQMGGQLDKFRGILTGTPELQDWSGVRQVEAPK